MANRLKTLNRTSSNIVAATNGAQVPQQQVAETPAVIDMENVKRHLDFIKNANKVTQKIQIVESLKETLTYRRTNIVKVFLDFPRFTDIPYMVRNDFFLFTQYYFNLLLNKKLVAIKLINFFSLHTAPRRL